MATLDDLLANLADEGIDDDVINGIREAVDAQAQNPELVRNLRAEISKRDERIQGYEKRERTTVLTEAGIPEKAHDRFLRDWNGEKADLEFTADNVKAAADEFGYQLAPAGNGTATQAGDAAEAQRREAAARAAQLRAEGTVETGVPPDAAAQTAAAEAAITPGNRQAIRESLALKRQQLQKAAGWT